MNEELFNECFERNMKAIDLEKAGKQIEANKLYEQNIKCGFIGSHPYNRLALFYHNIKDYKNEIRVIEAYFSTFQPEQLQKELESSGKIIGFNKRLQTAKQLYQDNPSKSNPEEWFSDGEKYKLCSNCNSKNRLNAKICNNCGNSFNVNVEINRLINWPSLDTPEKVKFAIEQSFPSKSGLKWTEILFLSYYWSFHVDQVSFPVFWFEYYAIDDPNQLLQSLISRGYICISSYETELKSLTSSKLKEILQQWNKKSTGKKADLIKRIIDNVPENYLSQLFHERKIELTDLGKKELEQNQYVIEYNYRATHFGVDIWWINSQLKTYPHMKYRDLIWGELNRQASEAMKYSAIDSFCSYIKTRETMIDFLLSEGKHYQKALTLICEAHYYKANTIAINEYLQEKKKYDDFVNHAGSYLGNKPFFSLLPKIDVIRFEKIRDSLCISNNELYSLIVNNLTIFSCTSPMISNEDLAGVIVATIENNYALAKSVYQEIENKLNQLL